MNENSMGVWCCLIICGLLAWGLYNMAQCTIKESADRHAEDMERIKRSSNVVVHVEFK